MFTESSLLKAKIDLYNISANFAQIDYEKANYMKNGKKRKKHIPYTLSQETEDASAMYTLVYGKKPADITHEQEEQIKGYLLNFRTHRTEYLKEAGGAEYYENSLDK